MQVQCQHEPQERGKAEKGRQDEEAAIRATPAPPARVHANQRANVFPRASATQALSHT